MIEQYLPQTNESATLPKSKKLSHLNKALVGGKSWKRGGRRRRVALCNLMFCRRSPPGQEASCRFIALPFRVQASSHPAAAPTRRGKLSGNTHPPPGSPVQLRLRAASHDYLLALPVVGYIQQQVLALARACQLKTRWWSTTLEAAIYALFDSFCKNILLLLLA